MKNPLIKFRPKKQQALKERILKNREGVLDVMGGNIQGARQCPFYLGQKCIGEFCEFFKEYASINEQTGKKFVYHRCVFNQVPELLIENIQAQRKTQELLNTLIEKSH